MVRRDAALPIIEARPLAQLFFEYFHLLLEVFDDVLLVAVDPTRQDNALPNLGRA